MKTPEASKRLLVMPTKPLTDCCFRYKISIVKVIHYKVRRIVKWLWQVSNSYILLGSLCSLLDFRWKRWLPGLQPTNVSPHRTLPLPNQLTPLLRSQKWGTERVASQCRDCIHGLSLHLGSGRKQSVRRKKNELLNIHVYCCARENAAEWTELCQANSWL